MPGLLPHGSTWMMEREAYKALRMTAAPASLPKDFFLGGGPAGGKSDKPPYEVRAGGVAVIPIHGPLFRRDTVINRVIAALFGGTGWETINRAVRTAEDDGSVRSIVLDIDSPGGEAAGNGELAQTIRDVNGTKPVYAWASGMMASAAYYLGAGAGEVWADPRSLVGSIGTVWVVVDDTAFQEAIGIKEIPFISSQSPDKWPDPKTEDGAARYQDAVDAMAQQFVEDVARFRGVPVSKVLDDFGRGWVMTGKEAQKVGMVDKTGSFEELVRKAAGRNRNKTAADRKPIAAKSAPDFNQLRRRIAAGHSVAASVIPQSKEARYGS